MPLRACSICDMEVFSIIIFGIVCAVLCVVLKEYKPEYAVMVSIMGAVIIMLFIMRSVSPILDFFSRLNSMTSLDGEYMKILLKSLGITLITQIGSDLCKDIGQTSISSKIELSGKVAVLIISLPLFSSVLVLIEKIIEI